MSVAQTHLLSSSPTYFLLHIYWFIDLLTYLLTHYLLTQLLPITCQLHDLSIILTHSLTQSHSEHDCAAPLDLSNLKQESSAIDWRYSRPEGPELGMLAPEEVESHVTKESELARRRGNHREGEENRLPSLMLTSSRWPGRHSFRSMARDWSLVSPKIRTSSVFFRTLIDSLRFGVCSKTSAGWLLRRLRSLPYWCSSQSINQSIFIKCCTKRRSEEHSTSMCFLLWT